jgi:hypothetical protein
MSQSVGNWVVPLTSAYTRREKGDAVLFDDGVRTVEVSAYTFEFEDMSTEDRDSVVTMFTENFRAEAASEEECVFELGELRARGVIRQEDDDDECTYWFLRGCITDGINACYLTTRFNDSADRAWAVDLFRSIRLRDSHSNE